MGRLVAAGRTGDAGLDPNLQRAPDAWDPLSAAEASLAVCEHVLSQMAPGDGKAQTPCAKFDVDQLAEHLCGSVVALGKGVGVDVTPDTDAVLEVRVADIAQPVLEGWRHHGLEGDVTLGPGPFPAEKACGILSMEFLVHAWDFAQATGRDCPTVDGLSTYVLGLSHELIQPSFRDGDNFGPEIDVADDAAPFDRLVAYTGRKP